jgi:hypothetical protein
MGVVSFSLTGEVPYSPGSRVPSKNSRRRAPPTTPSPHPLRDTSTPPTKSKMCWRDIVFTADGMILPPSWTAASDSVRGGAIRGAVISYEERVLLDLLAQTETHCQADPRSLANATREANSDAFSITTTPSMSRCGTANMATAPSIRPCKAMKPFPVPSTAFPIEDVDAGLDSETEDSDWLNDS